MTYTLALVAGSIFLFYVLSALTLKAAGTFASRGRALIDLPPVKELAWKLAIIAVAVNLAVAAGEVCADLPVAIVTLGVLLVLMGTLFDFGPLLCILFGLVAWLMHMVVFSIIRLLLCVPPSG